MHIASLPSPILVVGPAHSGKSAIACRLLSQDEPGIVIGTADVKDPYAMQRLAELKAQRPKDWRAIDAGMDLTAALAEVISSSQQLVVDSVNQWLARRLVQDMEHNLGNEREVELGLLSAVDELLSLVARAQGQRIVLVSSEAGAALPPGRAIERSLRRVLGVANQRLVLGCKSLVEVKYGLAFVLRPDLSLR